MPDDTTTPALQELAELKSLIVTNTVQMKVVVDTTHEIREQLQLMNGRVRQNREDVITLKANPSLTREYCDGKRGEIEKRIRALEGKLPSIIQNVVIALLTGGAMALMYFFLSKVP